MKLKYCFILLSTLLFACSDNESTSEVMIEDVAPPEEAAATSLSASPFEALERAGSLEQQMQEAAEKRRLEIEAQGG